MCSIFYEMQVNIKATDITLTPQINNYVNKKLKSVEKLINKKDTGVLCDIEVGRTTNHHKSGDIFRAEINLRTEGKTFYASSEKDDLYVAIDEMKNEVKNELLSYKTKKETLLKRGGAKVKSLLKNLKWRPRG